MSDAPMILWLDDAHDAPAAVLGGKFASLAEMTAAGFDVPPGFGITTAAFARFVAENGLAEEVAHATRRARRRRPRRRSRRRARRIAARFEQARFPSDLEAAIRERVRGRSASAWATSACRSPCAPAASARTSPAPASRASTTRSCG